MTDWKRGGETGAIDDKIKGRRGSLVFHEVFKKQVPLKIGFVKSLKLSKKRSSQWVTQVLVLQGNILSTFSLSRTLEQSMDLEKDLDGGVTNLVWNNEAYQTLKNVKCDVQFDLSEPTFKVSVVQLRNRSLDIWHSWSISVQRFQGLQLGRFKCATQEDRDQWVSALRSFESRHVIFYDNQLPTGRFERLGKPYRFLKRLGKRMRPRNIQSEKSSKRGNVLVVPSPSASKLASNGSSKSLGFRLKSWSNRSLGSSKVPSNQENAQPNVVGVMTERVKQGLGSKFIFMDSTELNERRYELIEILEGKGATREDAFDLLQMYDWDIDAAEAHLRDIEMPGMNLNGDHGKDADCREMQCLVCFEDCYEHDALACGHNFCKSCWGDYISGRIDDGKAVLTTKCMAADCDMVVPEKLIKEYARDGNQVKRFEDLTAASYVERCARVKWCPRPGCGKAVECHPESTSGGWKTSGAYGATVVCECSFEFCFNCGEEPHEPATCAQVTVWKSILEYAESCGEIEAAPRDERAFADARRWIIENSRPCPKCKSPIEKLQGCNHMKCSVCSHQFCWACFGPWEDHGVTTGGYFRCSVFEDRPEELRKIHDDAVAHARSEQEALDARARAEREKYAAQEARHRQSQVFHLNLSRFFSAYENHQNCMESIARLAESNQLPDCLSEAVKVVIRSRRVLRWAAVVSYFLSCPEVTRGCLSINVQVSSRHEAASHVIARSLEAYQAQDGPHRAIWLSNVGKLDKITKRVQQLVEAPVRSFTQNKFTNYSGVERELRGLSCRALDVAATVVQMSEEFSSLFRDLALPALPKICAANQQVHDVDDQSQEYSCINVSYSSHRGEWLCTLCGWKNVGQSNCLACAEVSPLNVFTRARQALDQQVRNCNSCSAELILPALHETACSCSLPPVFGAIDNFKPFGLKSLTNMIAEIEITCSECKRGVLDVPLKNEKAIADRATLLDDLDAIDRIDRPSSPSQVLCPSGHTLSFIEAKEAPVFECDACATPFEGGRVAACAHCNWLACQTCASVHGNISNLRHLRRERRSSYRPRRNAIHFASMSELPRGSGFRRRSRRSSAPSDSIAELVPERASPRMALLDLNSPQSQQANGDEIQGQPSGWECETCTFWNNSRNHFCEICSNSPDDQQDDDDTNHIPREGENSDGVDDDGHNSIDQEEQEDGGIMDEHQEDGTSQENSQEMLESPSQTDVIGQEMWIPSLGFPPTSPTGGNLKSEFLRMECMKPLSTPIFVTACSKTSFDKRRCLTLLKPSRRDPARLGNLSLGKGLAFEVWWETSVSKNVPGFQAIHVYVHLQLQNRSVSLFITSIPDVGVCTIQIPPMQTLLTQFPLLSSGTVDAAPNPEVASPVRMWVELRACALPAPGLPETLTVKTPIMHLVK